MTEKAVRLFQEGEGISVIVDRTGVSTDELHEALVVEGFDSPGAEVLAEWERRGARGARMTGRIDWAHPNDCGLFTGEQRDAHGRLTRHGTCTCGLDLARHHLLADSIERIGRHALDAPGLLSAVLRAEADYLDWSTTRDGCARPTDRLRLYGQPQHDPSGDWQLEDEHWAYKNAGGVPRFALRAMARRLAGLLEVRRLALKVGAVDGRPYRRAA